MSNIAFGTRISMSGRNFRLSPSHENATITK